MNESAESGQVVSLDKVSVHLGERLIQSSMSFSVEEGEFLAVLGPNGAGKTTLLRLLLGLIQPSSGSISVFGRPPRRGNRQIGYVPQFRDLGRGNRYPRAGRGPPRP